ncbi:hypothetical protein OVS_04100 [Mycoplasma ovis str. Michigan]|uniref:Lipoprotein n=1 Tax=Mycoplasma ovis str. Michigan TaxID=1415773 RepID=A0ABN4BMM4_9MOLU|nr:hypothetical protein OVS_04100 [Mycoplasma ovis str. Michigan]
MSAVAGGCIILPFLLKSNNSIESKTQDNSQKATPAESETIATEKPHDLPNEETKKSATQGTCEVIARPNGLDGFLDKRGKKEEDYVSVKCKNNVLSSQHIDLPPVWIGLFPKTFLSLESTQKIGEKFKLNLETKNEDGDTRSVMKAVFSGSGLKSTISGELDLMDEFEVEQQRFSVEIKDGGREAELIYLFLASPP